MRQLLVNLNNTNTSLAIAEGRDLTQCRKFSTSKLLQAGDLVGRWAQECEQTVLCSVVPGRSAVLEEWLDHRLISVGPELDLGFDLSAYPAPQSLGADRIANTAHAAALRRFPCMVVDFGTAITFDVIDDDGRFRGGVIAPGIGAFVDYLHEHTAQLPRSEFAKPETALATDTPNALKAGAFYGLTGVVKTVVTQILREGGWMQDQLFCIATGGYCTVMNTSMPGAFQHVDPDFTLHGIRLIGERNPGCAKS